MSTAVTTTFSANTKIKSTEMNQNLIDVFPTYTTWVPSYYKNDGTTSIAGTTRLARYAQHGKIVTAVLSASSIADPVGINLWWTLPVTAKVDGTYQKHAGTGYGADGVAEYASYSNIPATGGTKIAQRINRSSNWGSNNSIEITIVYEAA